MSFCNKEIHFPYFIVSRVYRDTSPIHYIFVGRDIVQKHKKLLENITNHTQDSLGPVSSILGKYITNTIKEIVKKKEHIIFVEDRIWLDEPVFSVKKKIFVYDRNNIPNYQQLWVSNKKEHKKVFVFDTEFTESPMSITPSIDKEYVNESNEFIGEIIDIDKNDMLYDILQIEYDPHIYVYNLQDELEWIEKNPIKENKKEVEKQRYMYGYIKKYWPFYDRIGISPDVLQDIQDLHSNMKKTIEKKRYIIEKIRNTNEVKIPFTDCIINNLVLFSRPQKEYTYYLQNIYNFLRTLLSEKIPYIYYTSYGDKKPYISIYEKSVHTKITKDQLYDWTYIESGKGNYVLKGKSGTIILKILYYSSKNIDKYCTLIIHKNGQLQIMIKYDESITSSSYEIEKHFSIITNIITTINTYLKKLGRDSFIVPSLQIKDEFILSEYTRIQYFTIVSYFTLKENIQMKKFVEYLSSYYPFVNTSLDKKTSTSVSFYYERVSKSHNIINIYNYIEKEISEKSTEEIIQGIVREFGKTIIKAKEIYNEWSILQENRTSASQIIRNPGVLVTIIEYEIKKNEYTYKIKYDNLKSLFVLQNCYHFLQKVIQLYLFSEDKPIQKKEIFDESFDIHFGFGEIQKNNKNNKNNINNKNILINSLNNNINTFTSSKNINLSDETNLDPKTRLQCPKEENKIIEKGVCKDVCDYPNFHLKRLVTFDKKLFKFSQTSDTLVYARQCEARKRPVIVTYDPEKEVEKGAITYSYKYGSSPDKQYYYMCPEAWCPTCEKPIPMDKLKDIQRKKCTFAKCPYGNHNVLINEEGSKYKYPGFLEKSKHPKGMCLPCCFSRDKRESPYYKRCLSIDETENNEDNVNEKYISRSDKIKINEDRYAILPIYVERYIGQKECESGPLKLGFDCYVRKGTKEYEKDSFINLIIDVISGIEQKKYTYSMIIEQIQKKIHKQLFMSLSGGLVKRMFSTIESYITFLQKKKYVEIFLMDIISRPGMFSKEGFNIIIFTPNSISCPKGALLENMYSLQKPTLLCLYINNIYQPIYKLQNIDNKTEEIVLHSSVLPEIQKLLEETRKQCSSYHEINWEKITGDTEKKENVQITEYIQKLEKHYSIELQVVDTYNKVSAIILSNQLYIPIEPSTILLEYPYIEYHEKIPILPFQKTITLLEEVYKKTDLPVKPLYYITKDTNIIGIVIQTKRIVPVLPIDIKKVKTKLQKSDIVYIPDKNIVDTKSIKRIQITNLFTYKNESFYRYILEVSSFLQTKEGTSYKKKLLDIVEQVEIQKKDYDICKKIIETITKKITIPIKESNSSIKNITSGTIEYKPLLLRTPCFTKKQKNNNYHCSCKSSSCKLLLLPNNFVDRITEMIIRYPIQRNDIIEGTVSIIDDKTAFSKKIENEVLLSTNKVDKDFYTLVKNSNSEYNTNIQFLNPTYEGINKKKYIQKRKIIEKNTVIIPVSKLSKHWISITKPNYRYITTQDVCKSIYYIYYSISIMLFNMKHTTNIGNLENISQENIIDIYCSYLLQLEKETIHTILQSIEPKISSETLSTIIDISDMYNYIHNDSIHSPDDLVEKIKTGYPVYNTDIFDIIIFSHMFSIKTIVLQKTISETYFTNLFTSDLYCVLFYKKSYNNTCNEIYLLEKNTKPYITPSNSTIKRLM